MSIFHICSAQDVVIYSEEKSAEFVPDYNRCFPSSPSKIELNGNILGFKDHA